MAYTPDGRKIRVVAGIGRCVADEDGDLRCPHPGDDDELAALLPDDYDDELNEMFEEDTA